ncbi:MAG: acyltransferase [Muribaculaceae bacterium]|nr:acyltransferase [Muribaculaceae bacterium]
MTTSFYSPDELASLGFKSVGCGVLLSRKASVYGASEIEIGNNVRIDDFCILSGKIKLGNNIHISAFVALYGSHGIELEDYTGISPRSTIFSAMDDFSGDYLIGPVHPENLTNIMGGKVILRSFSQIGASCVVFPGVEIGEGAVTGAMTLVNKSLQPWTINAGIPAKLIKSRNRNAADLV